MPRVALITGGTSGIGKAICKVLSDQGLIVYGTGRSVQNGEQTDGYRLLKMDVTSGESVQAGIKYLMDQEGKIDILINNAGIGIAGSIEDSGISDIIDIFNTNVAGIFRTCKSVIPIMRNQNDGYIINISSVGGLMGLPYRGIYCGSKASVESITEALSMEVMQFGIKVVLVEPGDFKTNINANRKTPCTKESSVYKEEFDRIHSLINSEVQKGEDPSKIGNLIYKIINTKKPRVRYNTGNLSSKMALVVKRIVPTRIFERIIMNHYKMKRK